MMVLTLNSDKECSDNIDSMDWVNENRTLYDFWECDSL